MKLVHTFCDSMFITMVGAYFTSYITSNKLDSIFKNRFYSSINLPFCCPIYETMFDHNSSPSEQKFQLFAFTRFFNI